MSSGLFLTLRLNPGPDQDNGVLQAWEVFESVRTDAELVTLGLRLGAGARSGR